MSDEATSEYDDLFKMITPESRAWARKHCDEIAGPDRIVYSTMSKGEQPKREPYLSDEAMERMSYAGDFFAKVRDFYEAKITSGELITKAEHERLVLQAILDHESNQQGTW